MSHYRGLAKTIQALSGIYFEKAFGPQPQRSGSMVAGRAGETQSVEVQPKLPVRAGGPCVAEKGEDTAVAPPKVLDRAERAGNGEQPSGLTTTALHDGAAIAGTVDRLADCYPVERRNRDRQLADHLAFRSGE